MATRYFHWSTVFDCVMHETDGSGNTLVTYTHEPSQYGPLLSESRGGTESYHHFDALGSTTMMTDDTGAVTDTFQYDAWGNEVARTGPTDTPYRWVGRWGYQYDTALGSHYIRARIYYPLIARWMSVDPLWELVQRAAYAYVGPVANRDPSGLRVVDPGANQAACLDTVKQKLLDDLETNLNREECWNAPYRPGEVRPRCFKQLTECAKKTLGLVTFKVGIRTGNKDDATCAPDTTKAHISPSTTGCADSKDKGTARDCDPVEREFECRITKEKYFADSSCGACDDALLTSAHIVFCQPREKGNSGYSIVEERAVKAWCMDPDNLDALYKTMLHEVLHFCVGGDHSQRGTLDKCGRPDAGAAAAAFIKNCVR